METFTKLFGAWLVFIYHCFDRIVISGYLMGLQRPGQVVYWLQEVLGIEAITKEVLSQRTEQYVRWVESYARNLKITVEWAEKDVRKEDYVQPYLRRMERKNQFGVYFIFQTMEQGWTYRPGRKLVVRTPGKEADYPILHRHRARYRYYYFYLRDEVLGPMILRMGTFLPFEASYYLNGHHYVKQALEKQDIEFRTQDNAFVSVADRAALQKVADSLSPEIIQRRLNYWTILLGPKFTKQDRQAAKLERSYYVHQVEYCQNFVFRRNHPIRKIFERSGGKMGSAGCVAYLFERKGLFSIDAAAIDEDTLFSIALDAGADDLKRAGSTFDVTCDPSVFSQVQEALQKNNLTPSIAEISQVPQAPVDVDAETGRKVMRLMEALDDQDDVQNVYSNINISEEMVAGV